MINKYNYLFKYKNYLYIKNLKFLFCFINKILILSDYNKDS